ncbi:STAS domain-containing protein [Sessilibacter corallicola]|uniref:STAS domain-containing protein n=1 Tax=Sessilibacter corallicola TaxID=2904075 RepID=A0ABQ0A490_9GAMM|nr:STAS domain-containing protein [Sessilibacter corallicola]MCE2026922.1 STAS domain-containing protein [Sessilibacter corallicola]
MSIEYQFDQSNSELLMLMDERFEFDNCGEFRSVYESVREKDIHNITVNFSHTRYIDSSALGMMINMKRFYSSQGVEIRLINCSDQIRRIFKVSHFDKQFDIS